MSLIEVLIAVLILGIGMLGIAAMQATALRNSTTSMQQSQAVIEANAMMDAMRANPSVTYSLGMAAAPCTPPTTLGSVVNSDKAWWLSGLQSTVSPNACGSISCSSGVCTVTVLWSDNINTTTRSESVKVVSRL
jgi:type IV pilus assembly protein PilV